MYVDTQHKTHPADSYAPLYMPYYRHIWFMLFTSSVNFCFLLPFCPWHIKKTKNITPMIERQCQIIAHFLLLHCSYYQYWHTKETEKQFPFTEHDRIGFQSKKKKICPWNMWIAFNKITKWPYDDSVKKGKFNKFISLQWMYSGESTRSIAKHLMLTQSTLQNTSKVKDVFVNEAFLTQAPKAIGKSHFLRMKSLIRSSCIDLPH